MGNSKKKTIRVILVLAFLLLVIGSTYAFITKTLLGNKQVMLSAGVLDLVLEEENSITISDAFPMYDEVGMIQDDAFKFKLVNNSSNSTDYKINLVDVTTGDRLSSNDVRYYLTKNGKGIEPDYLSNIGTDSIVVGETIKLQTINYLKELLRPIVDEIKNPDSLESWLEWLGDGSSYENIYDMMIAMATSTLEERIDGSGGIIPYFDDFGWALCNSIGMMNETECVSAIASQFPSIKSYEDIGKYYYQESLGVIPDTSSVDAMANSYCEIKLGAISESDCVDILNSFHSVNLSGYGEAVDYMLDNGMIAERNLTGDFSGTIDSGTIAGNEIIDYSLRLWIRDGVTDNNAIAGKSLSYKLKVEGGQAGKFVKASVNWTEEDGYLETIQVSSNQYYVKISNEIVTEENSIGTTAYVVLNDTLTNCGSKCVQEVVVTKELIDELFTYDEETGITSFNNILFYIPEEVTMGGLTASPGVWTIATSIDGTLVPAINTLIYSSK